MKSKKTIGIIIQKQKTNRQDHAKVNLRRLKNTIILKNLDESIFSRSAVCFWMGKYIQDFIN